MRRKILLLIFPSQKMKKRLEPYGSGSELPQLQNPWQRVPGCAEFLTQAAHPSQQCTARQETRQVPDGALLVRSSLVQVNEIIPFCPRESGCSLWSQAPTRLCLGLLEDSLILLLILAADSSWLCPSLGSHWVLICMKEPGLCPCRTAGQAACGQQQVAQCWWSEGTHVAPQRTNPCGK